MLGRPASARRAAAVVRVARGAMVLAVLAVLVMRQVLAVRAEGVCRRRRERVDTIILQDNYRGEGKTYLYTTCQPANRCQ